jgi:hypothetical protein
MRMHSQIMGYPSTWGCIPRCWGSLRSTIPPPRPAPHPIASPHPTPALPFYLCATHKLGHSHPAFLLQRFPCPFPHPAFHGFHGHQCIPWVPVDSMGTHRFHGKPWIPLVPIELLSAHGFHGHPWVPWVPTDPWIPMNSMGTYGFQGYRWNRRIPTHSMGTRGFHGHPWHY